MPPPSPYPPALRQGGAAIAGRVELRESSAKRDTAAASAHCDIPPAITTGCCHTPGSSGLRQSLPLASCLLTCLSPAGIQRCPQLLPAHLHPDMRLFLGAGNNGNRRGEDFWGRCVWSCGRHRLFVTPSSFQRDEAPVCPASGIPSALQALHSSCCWRGRSIQLFRGFTLLYIRVTFDIHSL